MMEFFDILKHVSNTEETLLVSLYSMILIASFLDVLFGWLNARLNPEKQFKSSKALYGIIRKMMYFLVLVFFMVIAYIMVEDMIAFTAIFTLTTTYLFSELISVLAHLGIVKDEKDNIFIDFLKDILKSDKEEQK